MSDFDLVIVGTGSANSIPGPEFDDWSIAIVERGVFGGTCLNVGCIPSKMFVYAADVADTIATAGSYGIAASFDSADWPAIRDRVFGRIDPIADGGRGYRIGAECPNITVFEGDARFVSDRRLAVRMHDGSTESVSGRHIVLGAGARPYLPPYRGLGTVPFHTSDTVMRLDSLPESMIVLGGGYIACELGYVFSALGTNVTVVNRGERLLRAEDDDVSAAFTSAAERHFDLRLGATVTSVSGGGDTGEGARGDFAYAADGSPSARGNSYTVEFTRDGRAESVQADVLLVATGRVPNGDQLALDLGGVEDRDGRVLTDEFFRTSAPGVWAFGDLSSEIQLKHLANAQVRALRHNLLVAEDQAAGPMRSVDERLVPHAVFSHPQVASVGLTERDARAAGLPISVANKPFGHTAYGWAMEDSTSFAKLIAHAETRELLGAHIIGPQASTLVQQLIQGMSFGQTVDQMAHGQFYIHPALTEVIENALLEL
ncbi:MAG: mycothione reductase [Acidimicrobiaceae bacterium]|nr:mycothione reductase [Acidimicrobiaceae bacterium]MXV87322.1 mycothione reductase [Acidimicrobiales bacterium]MCY3948314.1 mycothione reductase [Acidimicrobiaceae bacterium]MDE0496575.1 mycothione reductase [Acidimicrobiaceae bacterium]MYB80633.1 mycothione reductase [Acidimicrobiales bacterium]